MNTTTIHPTAEISPTATIGDYCEIGPRVRIQGDFKCGDYCKIHQDVWIFGQVSLGHCAWVGQNAILDGTGGLVAKDFVGIGASSQLWTHCAQGDRLQGCTLGAEGPEGLILEEDAWILPMTLCPPKYYDERTVYSGSPAKVFHKWDKLPDDEIQARWLKLIAEYAQGHELPLSIATYNPVARTYKKTHSLKEISFNKWLFHGRAYFRPEE